MRDVKFRVWDAENKKWLNHNLSFVVDPTTGKFGHVRDHKYIFQQYTGLLDILGHEIYEGDIIKIGTKLGVIKWVSEADGWGMTGWNSSALGPGDSLRFAEVVGNIFEHPELILEKEGLA